MTKESPKRENNLRLLLTSPAGSRGSVLIMSLIMGTIIFMLAVSFSTMVTLESKTVTASENANIALFCADTGLQRAFVELVNFTPITPPYADVDLMRLGSQGNVVFTDSRVYTDSQGKFGQYKATVFANMLSNIATYNTLYNPGPVGFGVIPGGMGVYEYIFTIESTGTVQRTDNQDVLARRTVVAKVLVERPFRNPLNHTEYQCYGKIQYYYEKYR